MKYRIVGSSGLKVSEIGFGCMSLLKTREAEAERIVAKAIDNGINYFDTADLYDKGENERLTGKLLRAVRSNIILATKVGNQWRKDGSGWDWNPRKAYILKEVDASLKRLQTDYIDLYQLHGGTIDDPIEETIDAFEQLVQEGKIRYYGISSIRPNVIRKYIELSDIKTVMMQYSLLDRRPEEEMLNVLHQHNISVMARGVLAQGLLIDKPARDYVGHTAATVLKAQQLLAHLASDKYSVTAVVLQYVLNNPAVAGAVVGFRTIEQLQDVLTAAGQPIPQALYDDLQQGLPAKKYTEHR